MSVNEKSYWMLRRERLTAAGICIDCANKPKTRTSKRCVDCSVKVSRYTSERYQREKNTIRTYRKVTNSRAIVDDMPTACVDYLVARFPDGIGVEDIGTALGISRARAEQILSRALNKFRHECEKLGIDGNSIIGRGYSMIATAEKWA